MHWKWRYFKPHEVLSPDGLAQYKQGNLMVQAYAMNCLSEIREDFGFPLLCNHNGLTKRGYRSPAENRAIPKSAQYSRHVQGIAFDLTPRGATLKAFLDFLNANHRNYLIGGIGFYPTKNFIHIDFRSLVNPTPSRWIG